MNLRREKITLALGAITLASFGYFIFLWAYFTEISPRLPNPGTGLIYPLNQHGTYSYVSASDATQLGILFWLYFPLFFATAFSGSNRVGKMPWQKYEMRPRDLGKYFFGTAILWLVVLWLGCSHLASALVHHGVTFWASAI